MIFLRVFLSFDKFQRSKLQVPTFEIEQIESSETSNLKHHRDEDLSMSLFLLHVCLRRKVTESFFSHFRRFLPRQLEPFFCSALRN